MYKFFKKNLALISFVLIPILFLSHPSWFELIGNQPYWPLFWLLPWSMIYGSINGSILGLFLGLILDSISPNSSFTQIPGLIVCGIWFGKFKISSDSIIGHFRYGLLCLIGSFFCAIFYYSQILIKNFTQGNLILFFPNIQNILAQVFLTGIFAPIICSIIMRLFQKSKDKSNAINFTNK